MLSSYGDEPAAETDPVSMTAIAVLMSALTSGDRRNLPRRGPGAVQSVKNQILPEMETKFSHEL